MTEGSVAHDAILDMLGRSTVLLGDPGDDLDRGSGFFIAPGTILTCAHVVRACGQSPRIIGQGGFRWLAREIVSSLNADTPLKDPEYSPFPDLALIFVDPDETVELDSGADIDIRCAWLTRSNTPGADSRLMTVTPQKVGRATSPGTVPLTFQWQTEAQAPAAVWVAAPRFPDGLTIRKGMSGSPVLDEDTLRVIGVVKASAAQGAIAHVTPVGAGLASLAALEGRRAARGGPESAGNPVIEAWHAHDLHHAGLDQPEAAGGAGAWPAYLADPPAPGGEHGQRGAPSAHGALEPLREASLFGLFARAEQPQIDLMAEALYRRYAQAPRGRIFPGPIHCLRDAAWHLARAGGTVEQARVRLGLLARHVAAAAELEGLADLAADLDAWAQDAPPEVRAEPLAGPGAEPTPVPHAGRAWPAGVLVKIKQSFGSEPEYPRYIGTIGALDGYGNWQPPYTCPDPLPLEELLDRLRDPLQAEVDALGPAAVPVIEFVVPRNLFDYPFDRWLFSDEVPLGEDLPVVIRDGRTFEESCTHFQSVRSWNLFEQSGGHPAIEVTCAELPARGEQALFRGRLNGTPPAGTQSLRGRLPLLPGRTGPEEPAGTAMNALRQARTPLALWTNLGHQHDGQGGPAPCSGAAFTSAAALGVHGVPLDALPHAVNELRQQARMDEESARRDPGLHPGVNADNHPLAYAVLLWDLPHRKPDVGPLAPPAPHAPAEKV